MSTPEPLPRGIVPPGTYAGGGRSPIVYVLLCPPCAGYAPLTEPDYRGALSGPCGGCGAWTRELHRFPAVITSARGCCCNSSHARVTGDLPNVDGAAREVQRAWDREFTNAPGAHNGVDYRQARIAVETALGLTDGAT